jgi:hypothetical protein
MRKFGGEPDRLKPDHLPNFPIDGEWQKTPLLRKILSHDFGQMKCYRGVWLSFYFHTNPLASNHESWWSEVAMTDGG